MKVFVTCCCYIVLNMLGKWIYRQRKIAFVLNIAVTVGDIQYHWRHRNKRFYICDLQYYNVRVVYYEVLLNNVIYKISYFYNHLKRSDCCTNKAIRLVFSISFILYLIYSLYKLSVLRKILRFSSPTSSAPCTHFSWESC